MMYSLYRAWFGGEESYPRLETLSPPDTVVRVGNEGEHQFVAHRGVLAAHSGYLKALLANTTNSNANSSSTTASGGTSGNAFTVTSVSVSSVDGEAFAPLLNYMYTGRLEVTWNNIYNVLLATHLLHMPGATEQCRAALLRLRTSLSLTTPSPTQAGNVLRPVPNRLVGPPLCWPPQPALYPPGHVGLSHLSTLSLPPTMSAMPTSRIMHEAHSTVYSARETSTSPKASTSQTQRLRRSRSRSATPDVTSPTSRRRTEEVREAEGAAVEEEEERVSNRTLTATRSPSPSGSSERISVTGVTDPPRRKGHSKSSNDRSCGSSSSVVFDVASCDGPVRFHRVLNENYSAPAVGIAQRPRACVDEDVVSSENDENGRPEGTSEESNRSGGSGGSYTCGYCKHTFKSHYCYQKHARRHLHPAEVDGNGNGNSYQVAKKREVRLLDLNVQYYPCKICGSKFPSYYFVHKHRKLCHSNPEDTQSGSDENSNVARSDHSGNTR